MAGNPMFNPRNLGVGTPPGANPMDAALEQASAAPKAQPKKRAKTTRKKGAGKPKQGGNSFPY